MNKEWTGERADRLMYLASQGTPAATIAKNLGTTPYAVYRAAQKYGFPIGAPRVKISTKAKRVLQREAKRRGVSSERLLCDIIENFTDNPWVGQVIDSLLGGLSK